MEMVSAIKPLKKSGTSLAVYITKEVQKLGATGDEFIRVTIERVK